MAIIELLEKVRRLNVRALEAVSAQHSPCHIEAALRSEDGRLVGDGPNGLPCRVDILPISENGELLKSIMVDPPTRLSFEKVQLKWDGMAVQIEPFGWDYSKFSVDFPESPELEPLLEWFWSNFDAEDENEESVEGLYGVVHYLSDLVVDGGNVKFTVDFGSAQVETFISLISTLRSMGASYVGVG